MQLHTNCARINKLPPALEAPSTRRPAAPCRYFTFGAATAMLAIGLSARPDSSLSHWADRKAAENLGQQ